MLYILLQLRCTMIHYLSYNCIYKKLIKKREKKDALHYIVSKNYFKSILPLLGIGITHYYKNDGLKVI